MAWNASTLLRGDLVKEVEALKRKELGGGLELQVHGSCGLAQTLLAHGLVDELRLLTFPVLLGQGRRLFNPGASPRTLSLLGSRTTGTGVVLASYRVEGPVKTGSFELP